MIDLQRKFIVFSMPRSGSTNLIKVLDLHNEIRCVPEAFHPESYKRWNDIQPEDVLDAHQLSSFNLIKTKNQQYDWIAQCQYSAFIKKLDLLHQRNNANGLDCKLHTLPWKLIEDLLVKHGYNIVLLRRKNYLQMAMSGYMSGQLKKYTPTREEILQFHFQQINPNMLESFIKLTKVLFRKAERALEQHHIEYHEIYYEDLYGELLTGKERIEKLNGILKYLGFSAFNANNPPEAISELISRKNKSNSPETYRKVPNVDEIEKKLGCKKNGYLFK